LFFDINLSNNSFKEIKSITKSDFNVPFFWLFFWVFFCLFLIFFAVVPFFVEVMVAEEGAFSFLTYRFEPGLV
jgi:hypothetical protein